MYNNLVQKIDERPQQDNNLPDKFETGSVLTVAGGHFAHDTFSAFLSTLLPLLRTQLGINYAGAGSLAIFMQIPSLLTPFIGYLADRISLRYFIILAPAVTATLMSLLGLAPNYISVVILLFATGISVAAFHAPSPAVIARVSGSNVGRGMSIYMAGGELGRTLGPLLVATGIGMFGFEGIWRLMFIGWAVSLFLFWRLHNVSARPKEQRTGSLADIKARAVKLFPLLFLLMFARMFMIASLTTFLTTFMVDVKLVGLGVAAFSLFLLEGAGVVGALFAGTLSDRLGRRNVLSVLFLLAPIFAIAFLYAPSSLHIPLLLLVGFCAISPTPVFLAIVQDQFPNNRATANGIFISGNFFIRSTNIFLLGLMADRLGLETAFLIAAIIAFACVPLSRFLPSNHNFSAA